MKRRKDEDRKITPPTPGRSQEKSAWIDHSKRQPVINGMKINSNPALKKKKKRKFR